MSDHDPKSLRWQSAFEWLSTMMLATGLFWLATMLVITAPAAITALFAAVAGAIRPVPAEVFGRFIRSLKATFGRSLLLFGLNLIAGALLYFDIRLFLALGSLWALLVAYLFGLIAIALAMVNLYAWPLLAWYPRPLGRLLRQSFLLAVAHPIPSLMGLVAPATAFWAFLMLPRGLNVLVMMFGPAIAAYLGGKAVWAVLQRYPLPDSELTFDAEKGA